MNKQEQNWRAIAKENYKVLRSLKLWEFVQIPQQSEQKTKDQKTGQIPTYIQKE